MQKKIFLGFMKFQGKITEMFNTIGLFSFALSLSTFSFANMFACFYLP